VNPIQSGPDEDLTKICPSPANQNTTTTTRSHHNTQQPLSFTHHIDHNSPSGEIMTTNKPPHTLRLYFQNINGISKNKWFDWQQASLQLHALHIDMFGCAETNTTWTDTKRKYAQYQIQKINKQANLSVCSSTEVGSSDYQPGGVASCITGKWTGRITETINDPSGLGRWAGHIIHGGKDNNIVVITAYRPTKSLGFQTNYQQQWRMLRNNNDPKPDPRKKMLQDLEKTIIKYHRSKSEIILMWDANEGIKNQNSKLHQFMTNTNLLPAHTSFPTATYSRGSTCIDFIMAT
jgi:hypothetical protein